MAADRASFRTEELLAHAGWLRALSSSLVSDRSDADDLMQETWLAALRHPPRAGLSLRPWLARVARNLARNARRRDVRRGDREALAQRSDGPISPDAIAGEVEVQRMLAEAVLRLDEPLRTTVVLRYFRGLNASQIATMQRIPPGTVRWRLKNAIEALRHDLDGRFHGDRSSWCAALTALLPAPTEPIAASGAAAATGASIMSTTAKMAIAAALAALVGFGAWKLGHVNPGEPRSTPALADATARPTDPEPLDPMGTREETGREEIAAGEPGPAAVFDRPPLLAEACCIVGRVVDEAGQPVLQQEFYVMPADAGDGALLGSSHAPRERFPSGNTRDSGTFRIEVPAAQPFVIASVISDRFAYFAMDPCFAGETYEIIMTAGATLHASVVTVRDGRREPVPGVTVSARTFLGSREIPHMHASGATDAHGSVVLPRIPAATIRVRSGGRGFGMEEATLVSDGTGELRCELVLAASATLQGTVIDASNGLPIANAMISVGPRLQCWTDAAGRFELTELRPEPMTRSVSASARGHATAHRYVRVETSGMAPPLLFQLEPAERARGRVVDSFLQPIAGASLLAVAQVPTEPFLGETQRGEAETDVEGRFELEQLRSDTVYRMVVLAEGHGTGAFTVGPLPRSTGTADLGDLVLSRPGSIAGRVEKEPQPGTTWLVRLLWNGDPPHATPGQRLAHLASARADPRGRFTFSALGPGPYRLQLVASPQSRKRGDGTVVEALTVELKAGEALDGVVFAAGDSVSGRIVDTQGAPVPDCRVSLHSGSSSTTPLAVANADDEGRFRLPLETEGPFEIVVEDPRLFHESRIVEGVRAGDAERRIVLDPYLSEFAIRGRIVDPGGRPLAQVYVAFTDTTTKKRLGRVAIPDESGRFDMRNLRDLPYDVELVDFGDVYHPAKLPGVRPSGDDVLLRVERRE